MITFINGVDNKRIQDMVMNEEYDYLTGNKYTVQDCISTIKSIAIIAGLISVVVLSMALTIVTVGLYKNVIPLIDKMESTISNVSGEITEVSNRIILDSDDINRNIIKIRGDIDKIAVIASNIESKGLNITQIGVEYISQMTDDLNRIAKRIG